MKPEKLLKKVKSFNKSKIIFCDYFDTIAHRKVHPNYVLRLWAKFMIREIPEIKMETDELYFIRKDVEKALQSKTKKRYFEIPYIEIINEIYKRLRFSNHLQDISCLLYTSPSPRDRG